MPLGLLDLVAPQFLIDDFRLPDEVHNIVAFLRVTELESAWDETGVTHWGRATFEGKGDASPMPVQRRPTGELFEWGDVNVEFRLTIPRAGSPDLKGVIDTAAGVTGATSPIGQLKGTLDRFGAAPATGVVSDYPGFAFRLELLLSAITLHLPKKVFVPARVAPDGGLEPDPAFEDVRLVLPKVAVVVTRDNKLLDADADFEGWGVTGLDDDLDPAAGELISMVPPLALHESGVFGFGLEKAVLDLSADHTPAEILEHFGTGEDFRGLWLPHVRVFVAPKKAKGLAFQARAQDLLIDFREGVSGEFALEVLNRVDGKVTVEPRLFEGQRMILPARGHTLPSDPRSTVLRGSRASVAADGELQLAISGGLPPYTVTVQREQNGTTTPILEEPVAPAPAPGPQPNGGAKRVRWPLTGAAPGTATLKVKVVDSSPSGKVSVWDEDLELAVREAGNRIGTTTIYPLPTLTEGDGTPGYRLQLSSSQLDPGAVLLLASPAPLEAVIVTGANPTPSAAGEVRVPVTADGTAVDVIATWPTGAPAPLDVPFGYDAPGEAQVAGEVERIKTSLGAELAAFVARAAGQPISVTARAAYDGDPSNAEYKRALSQRRAQVLKQALEEVQAAAGGAGGPRSTITALQSEGFKDARNAFDFARPSYVPQDYENATATFETGATAPQRAVTVSRPAPTQQPLVIPTERGPLPQEPQRPPLFRKIAARVRLERSRLVLFEISGEVDIQTAAEDRASVIRSSTPPDSPVNSQTGTGLAIKTQPGASADPKNNTNPGDGVVDYRFTVSYDTASRRLTEELALGAGADDRDGLLHVENSTPPGAIGNVGGALLVFAPLLAGSVGTAVTAQGGATAVPIALAGAQVGLAATLGLTGALAMRRILWYGAELQAAQTLGAQAAFEEAALLLDYGVEFAVDIDVGGLKVQSKPETPLKVRYRALGFKLDFGEGPKFQPVFDTSKGYELDLADPGLFNVSSPFGDIIKVLGARVARTNPLVAEFDLGVKVNLGVVTVDNLKVTWPLDPPGAPMLLPTGLSVNIPGVLTGKGFVDLRGGFKGSLDLTLVPVKLRIAGGVGIEPIAPPKHQAVPDRKVTAVIVTLQLEFPTAVPLANSGLGLYGILGLFAMHFKRNENKAAEVPALDWLTKVNGDPTDLTGWTAEVDRWAFGVGAVLGTLGSATVVNLKGMLVLELPGPRILVFVKLQILTAKPPTKGGADAIGILAVVDLDFELHKLTIGVALAYDVDQTKSLLSLRLPVGAHFNFDEARDWRFDAGTIQNPGSALILNIAKASGYLMFAGKEIAGFPSPPGPDSGVLPGFAIALGVRAALTLGSESAGLFFKVSARLDAALVFSPFHIYGLMELKGQLRLFVISLSAWATLEVDAPDPVIVDGHACASIDLFFFEISGCIDIHIGPDQPALLKPPDLVNGMALQSRSPALVQGQGTDRPIDAKLIDALDVGAVSPDKSDPALQDLARVPIDAVPLLKLNAAPNEKGCATFTLPLEQPPRQLPDGWMDQGGGRAVRYVLKRLEISPPPPASPFGLPPATWRAESDAIQGQDTAVDLALFSWEPVSDARAAVRSTELTKRVGTRWGGVCAVPAPPARVLWTFNRQPLGPLPGHWRLTGRAMPDPPGTRRAAPPDKVLLVQAPEYDPELVADLADAGGGNLEPARIVGFDARAGAELYNPVPQAPGRVLQLPFLHIQQKPPAPPPPPRIVADGNGAPAATPPQSLVADLSAQRVTVESGPIKQARLLLCRQQTVSGAQIVIRALGANGSVLRTDTEATLPATGAPTLNELPVEWRNLPEVADVMELLRTLEFRTGTFGFVRRLVSYTPPAGTVRFEIVASVPVGNSLPVAYLGVVELLRDGEVARAAHDEAARSAQIKTVEGALAAGRPRPLLAPDTRYTVGLTYTSEARQEVKGQPGTFTTQGFGETTQRYTFVTDAAPPPRLDPWVLTTTPSEGEAAHFVDDPLRVVFNDRSAVQLFKAYGKSLRAVVRQANGAHPPEKPALDLGTMLPLKAGVLTPFEEALRNLMRDGGVTGCVKIPESESHWLFKVPVPLERSTAYTLDVEPTDQPPFSSHPADAPQAPLFRVAFSTSRFRSAAELGAVMRTARVGHRVLKGAIGTLSSTLTDIELEDALVKAGLEARPATGEPAVTLLWEPKGGDFVLTSVLVDAPEPLWRFRPEAVLVTEDGQGGPVKHYTDVPRPWLEMVATSPSLRQVIRTSGGTRGLVLLNPGATSLTLSLKQNEHPLIDATKSTTTPLFSATLPAVAPWRSDDA